MFKLEGQCELCENMATEIILDENMMDDIAVCDECFKGIFKSVADNGAQFFLEWAEEMYGTEKAMALTGEIYGQQALNYLIGDDSMSRKKKTRKDEKMITLFTYGILKYPHNIQREGGINIIENATIKGHKMYLYNSSFPITMQTANRDDIVYGTLFDVPESQVYYSYDFTEGYDPKRPYHENMYNRMMIEVTTPTGEKRMAQMYYANQYWFADDYNNDNLISTGNFDDRHLTKSYGQRKYRKGGK